jgi:uncharacterized protein
VLKDIPRLTAITVVAPRERRNALAIFLTPFLSRAIDFNNRKSSLVQRRGTIFLAILAPSVGAALSIAHRFNLSTRRALRGTARKSGPLISIKENYTMEYFYAPFECKADNSNDGTILGYGSVFNNIDSYGDIVAPGAFKKTISDVMTGAKAWPAMLLQHGDDTSAGRSPIGIWTSMEEDSTGLRLQGKLAIKTRRGSEAYELLKMRPRAALNGLSIGYRAKNYTIHKTGPVKRTLTEIELVECSLVTFPADKFARVVGVKSYVEPLPVVVPYTMRELARADFEMLRKEMTKGNRQGW